MYEMPAQKGGMRPTTLRDWRKFYGTEDELVPSVTAILKQAAAPGLELWKQKQTMLAALTLFRILGEDEQSFLNRIIQDSKEQARKAAERGTEIHASIQSLFEGKSYRAEHRSHVLCAVETLASRWPGAEWIAEKSFACDYGFGGKVDLHCWNAVVDIKTKEFGPENLPDAYPEHGMQLAAYALGLGLPQGAVGANLFISASNPGLAHLHVWEPAEMKKSLRMFMALLEFWKAKNIETETV